MNVWTHIAWTYDNTLGSQNLKLYINKTVQTDTGNLTEAINLSDELTIGNEVAANTPSCFVKDFRWFTIKALTQTEINNIYDSAIAAPAPNFWLLMTDGYNNPIDAIGGLVGTLTSGALWVNDDIGNHYRNKLSISAIPYGHVAVTDYYAVI